MYLAFDPGDTTGWAHLGPEGFPKSLEPMGAAMGQVQGQWRLWNLLESIEDHPRVIIYEEFRVRGDYAKHFGKTHEVIQNIGLIKGYFFKLKKMGLDVKLVSQPATRKDMGIAWSGLKKSGPHSESHRKDAMGHAVFYVVNKNIRPIIRLNDRG